MTAKDVRQLIAREITPEQAVLSVILPKNGRNKPCTEPYPFRDWG